jgi:predicted CXXCH cytochrome family protein
MIIRWLARLAILMAAQALPCFSADATFVGSAACSSCHAQQAALWKGSDHERAMQPATQSSVLGNFRDARFNADGVDATFLQKDGKFLIRTQGPDGKRGDFEVKYTFGWKPLQQYLVELPRGRLQAFTIAWDTRPKEKGGQRWFNLYPGERIKPGDELHWSGSQQNWNYMCADCHSTNLRKGYDAATDTFKTTWSEVTVGCESCHGPGSNHAGWAKAGGKGDVKDKGLTAVLDERRGVKWVLDPASGNSTRGQQRTSNREIEVCAQCHSRRAQLAEGYVAGRRFLDHYRPSLPTPPLYFANGLQKEEVYNWGSFIQSRMHDKGVTCSDCHEPHSGSLRAKGNAVCAQCHLAAKYDEAKHHRHKAGSDAAQCVSCHMPARTYMGIDARHDHGFSIPRPDLTVQLGAADAPNACNGCHRDKDAKWAAAALGAPKAHARPQLPEELARLLAADRAGSLAPPDRLANLVPMLHDHRLAVRLAALPTFVEIPSRALSPEQQSALDAAIWEYRAVQAYNADRPEAHANLGNLEARLGQVDAAERAYETAIRMNATFTPAYVNFADMRSRQGREADAEKLLRRAIAADSTSAVAHHALGLCLAREKRMPEALAELERAARLRPEEPRFAYVYGVGLHDTGSAKHAIDVLRDALRRHPRDPNILFALAEYVNEAGDRNAATAYARKLVELSPGDPQAAQLLERLQRSK